MPKKFYKDVVYMNGEPYYSIRFINKYLNHKRTIRAIRNWIYKYNVPSIKVDGIRYISGEWVDFIKDEIENFGLKRIHFNLYV
ncbi:hypothetical protein [Thermosipho sp. 1074]|uniref:hypothetical protein n=1 Tax=Thermosipho sp. 1074 TaxID=1643331 RepID=UPI000985DBDA|nr:hypothetical protein [Thermosipho sp. 1074]OOC42174.1 hypothetical protein XO08_07775 [Thermosipho sp. 1074]